MTKAYVANPYGFSEAGRHFLYDKFMPALEEAGIEIIDPWADAVKGKSNAELMEMAGSTDAKKAIEIGKGNMEMIRRADIVIAVLDGPDVDSGTAAEIGYAVGLGKTAYGYRGDFRTMHETSELSVNLQVAATIAFSKGKIFTGLAEMTRELKRLHPRK